MARWSVSNGVVRSGIPPDPDDSAAHWSSGGLNGAESLLNVATLGPHIEKAVVKVSRSSTEPWNAQRCPTIHHGVATRSCGGQATNVITTLSTANLRKMRGFGSAHRTALKCTIAHWQLGEALPGSVRRVCRGSSLSESTHRSKVEQAIRRWRPSDP
jgi:hypothetical protein